MLKNSQNSKEILCEYLVFLYLCVYNVDMIFI